MLGELLGGPPQQPAAAEPGAVDQWKQKLSDPRVRAFMINAGMQLMMPNYLGRGGAIAQAFGAGAEGFAAADQELAQTAKEREELERAESNRAQSRSDALAKDERDFAQEKELKNMTLQAQREMFGVRSEANLVKSEQQAAAKEIDDEKARIQNEIMLSPDDPPDEESIRIRLLQAGERGIQTHRALFGKKTSEGTDNGTGGGGSAPAETGAKNTSGNLATGTKRLTEEQLKHPSLKRPEIRAQLRDMGYTNVPE